VVLSAGCGRHRSEFRDGHEDRQGADPDRDESVDDPRRATTGKGLASVAKLGRETIILQQSR
jgi:hypothetical protein